MMVTQFPLCAVVTKLIPTFCPSTCHLLCHLAEKDLYYYVFVQHLSQLKVYREGGALPPGVCLDCLGINWRKNAD